MKIRTKFVSNSSSSSFICDFCGREESGMDLSLEEVDMYNCKNNHFFCGDEMVMEPLDFLEGKYSIGNISKDMLDEFFAYVDYEKSYKYSLLREEDILLAYNEMEKMYDLINDKDKIINYIESNTQLKRIFDFFLDEAKKYDNWSIPAECCPVCARKKEMEKDPEYKEYVRLFTKFKNITPNGCLVKP